VRGTAWPLLARAWVLWWHLAAAGAGGAAALVARLRPALAWKLASLAAAQAEVVPSAAAFVQGHAQTVVDVVLLVRLGRKHRIYKYFSSRGIVWKDCVYLPACAHHLSLSLPKPTFVQAVILPLAWHALAAATAPLRLALAFLVELLLLPLFMLRLPLRVLRLAAAAAAAAASTLARAFAALRGRPHSGLRSGGAALRPVATSLSSPAPSPRAPRSPTSAPQRDNNASVPSDGGGGGGGGGGGSGGSGGRGRASSLDTDSTDTDSDSAH